jgi:hypothetical protein
MARRFSALVLPRFLSSFDWHESLAFAARLRSIGKRVSVTAHSAKQQTQPWLHCIEYARIDLVDYFAMVAFDTYCSSRLQAFTETLLISGACAHHKLGRIHMFGSDVLDIGIGMSLLFLMMSLIHRCSRGDRRGDEEPSERPRKRS